MTTSELIKLTKILPLLGGGASREVYDLGNNLVLKVPKNLKIKNNNTFSRFYPNIFMEREKHQPLCCEQMHVEHFMWERYGDLKILCPIVEYGWTETLIPYTIMKKAECIDDYIWGNNEYDLYDLLNKNGFSLSKDYTDEIADEMRNCENQNGFYKIIFEIFNETEANNIKAAINFLGRQGISKYDLMEFKNIGFVEGKLVFIDYGYYYTKKYDF